MVCKIIIMANAAMDMGNCFQRLNAELSRNKITSTEVRNPFVFGGQIFKILTEEAA